MIARPFDLSGGLGHTAGQRDVLGDEEARIVRGALLKGVGLADAWPSVMALAAFVVVVTALAIVRYRTTLD